MCLRAADQTCRPNCVFRRQNQRRQIALILTSKKRNSACKFVLQRVPRPLTLNLTLKVKGQGHRKYCDTCPRGLHWFWRRKKRNSACKFVLQRVPRPLTLNLTLKVKGQGHRKYWRHLPTWFALILTSKKRNSVLKTQFGLLRVPRPLTFNLTLKVTFKV